MFFIYAGLCNNLFLYRYRYCSMGIYGSAPLSLPLSLSLLRGEIHILDSDGLVFLMHENIALNPLQKYGSEPVIYYHFYLVLNDCFNNTSRSTQGNARENG